MTRASRLLAVLLVLGAALPAMAQPRPLLVTLKFVPQESVHVAGTALPPSVLDRSVEIRVQDRATSLTPQPSAKAPTMTIVLSRYGHRRMSCRSSATR